MSGPRSTCVAPKRTPVGSHVGVSIGAGDAQEDHQNGYAEPVIESAFDIEDVANVSGDALVLQDRLPQGRVGRRNHCCQHRSLPQGQARQEQRGDGGPRYDNQRKAEQEQAQRGAPRPQQVLRGSVCGVNEQHQGKGDVGQQVGSFRALGPEQVQAERSSGQSGEKEEDGRRQR